MGQAELLTPEGFARSLCQELHLRPPFTAREFAEAVERQWQVRIVIEPWPSGEFTTGYCAAQNGVYTIYYYVGGSVVQRERILFHELAHIVMGHLLERSVRRPGALRAVPYHTARQRMTQEYAVEQVARALGAYSMLGEPPEPRPLQPVPPLSAYARFIDSLLAG